MGLSSFGTNVIHWLWNWGNVPVSLWISCTGCAGCSTQQPVTPGELIAYQFASRQPVLHHWLTSCARRRQSLLSWLETLVNGYGHIRRLSTSLYCLDWLDRQSSQMGVQTRSWMVMKTLNKELSGGLWPWGTFSLHFSSETSGKLNESVNTILRCWIFGP